MLATSRVSPPSRLHGRCAGAGLASNVHFNRAVMERCCRKHNDTTAFAIFRSHQLCLTVVMFSGGEVPDETRQLVDAVVPKTDARRELVPTVTQLCDSLTPS